MANVQKRVEVSIKGNQLSVKPIRISIKPTGEEVVWNCKGGRLDILFNKVTSPFGKPQLQVGENTDLRSGKVTTKTLGPYPYTLVITPTDKTCYPVTVDPQVDIDNPGPPIGTFAGKPIVTAPSPVLEGDPPSRSTPRARRGKATTKRNVRSKRSRGGKKK